MKYYLKAIFLTDYIISLYIKSTKCLQWLRKLDQYAIAKFSESFEMIPRTLAEMLG